MTDAHKPLDAALDLFVFVPVGLAVTAAEELPKLAAKGRARVNTQLTMARVVGQFAVSRGRSLLEQRIEQVASPGPADRPSPEGNRAGRPEPEGEAVNLTYDELLGDSSANGSTRPPLRAVPTGTDTGGGESPEEAAPNVGLTERPLPGGAPPSAGMTGVALPGADHTESNAAVTASTAGDLGSAEQAVLRPNAAGLAIPGYDSLSASQVVQRLAGLSREELAAVGAYEEAHRGRRTILNRVNQLQGD